MAYYFPVVVAFMFVCADKIVSVLKAKLYRQQRCVLLL